MFIIAFHPFGTIITSDFPENEVVVAVSLPFEGEMAEFGVEYMRGIELAIEDINNAGGIRGVPVRAEYYDNKGNVTLAKGTVQRDQRTRHPGRHRRIDEYRDARTCPVCGVI